MQHIGLLDPIVLNTSTIDCDEAIVEIHTTGSKLILDNQVTLGYQNQFVARQSIVEKLIAASLSLPEGYWLSVKETFRPHTFQCFIFNRRLINLFCSEENAHLTSQEIHALASQYIAPPHVAGHPTGGAVDVSLVNAAGEEFDLGCQYDEDPKTSQGRCYSFCSTLGAQVLANRQILFDCMKSVGFINYPFEWWHWSYGDKYWAAITGAPHAIYGGVDLGSCAF